MNLCLVWSTFLLSFAHFSTIPAHALALFQSPHSGVVVSAIGFSDTMAYAVLSLLNATLMSDESDANRFTWLVAVLSSCSFAAGLLSFFVPKKVDQQDKSGEKDDRQLKDKHEKELKVNEAFEDDFEEVGNDQRV